MNALFGEDRAIRLRQRLKPLSPEERELTVVEEIAEALKAMGGKYVLPFCFRNEKGTRTSHHLIFVSKHFRGYEIMKEIMAEKSSRVSQGVPSFVYSPADERQPSLFDLARPLDDLEGLLLTEFAGRKLTMDQIYQEHSIGRLSIRRNYKEVLRQMEAEGKITTFPPADQRRKGNRGVTFADGVLITFPSWKLQGT